jgi:hypothetical protein
MTKWVVFADFWGQSHSVWSVWPLPYSNAEGHSHPFLLPTSYTTVLPNNKLTPRKVKLVDVAEVKKHLDSEL